MPLPKNQKHAELIEAARRYAEDLGWRLIPVSGKTPIWRGWPDYYPGLPELLTALEDPTLGIGLNLGGSGLIDLEADTPEGEMILDDLCEGLEFPCWRSKNGKHRLFQAHPEVGYLKIEMLIIEFRTGRHQSVLPPSPHPSSGTRYEWIINPFDVPPPPLPDVINDYYGERMEQPGSVSQRSPRAKASSIPFRDDLDYVLRHFDLMRQVEHAGMAFAARCADENGNIPCHVPGELRGGKADDHPSGVFNIRSGVLRDFSSEKNHPFFEVMSALTGKPWLDLFKQFEKEAKAQHGRPHSRRIAVPTPTTLTVENVSLDEARQDLARYYVQQFSRPPRPKTLHLIKGQPGIGKTYTLCQKAAQHDTKAIILTLENELADTHVKTLTQFGGNARRMPVLRNTPCPHPDEYEVTSRRGFQPSQSLPCRKCAIGPKNCPYLLGFGGLEAADQICCAAIYHTHDGFYDAYGNDARPIVVFDENCVDFLLAPLGHSLNSWLAWGQLLMEKAKSAKGAVKSQIATLLQLASWLESAAREFIATTDDAGRSIKFHPIPVPKKLCREDLKKSPALDKWLTQQAFEPANKHIPNLCTPSILLMQNGWLLLERIGTDDNQSINVRFRAQHPLPENKEVFILDATVNEQLIRAIAPDWDICIYEPPSVQQRGKVLQIMDYDVSRNFITKQVARHRAHNPSWLVQVVDAILDKHGSASLISFKKATHDPSPEYGLVKKLTHADKLVGLHNFPCRGHTFDNDCLIVLGTPYKDEATIWELALAVYGWKGLPQSRYSRRLRQDGDFVAENMGYEEDHLRAIQEFLVSAELSQAIGRVRPLQNERVVYVVSNARIIDWAVKQFMSNELFDLRRPVRSDKAQRYEAYSKECLRQLREQGWTTNSSVCETLGIKEMRRGRELMALFREDYKKEIAIKGQRVLLLKSTTGTDT